MLKLHYFDLINVYWEFCKYFSSFYNSLKLCL